MRSVPWGNSHVCRIDMSHYRGAVCYFNIPITQRERKRPCSEEVIRSFQLRGLADAGRGVRGRRNEHIFEWRLRKTGSTPSFVTYTLLNFVYRSAISVSAYETLRKRVNATAIRESYESFGTQSSPHT